MAGRAIHHRSLALETLDRLQVLLVDVTHHIAHLTGDSLFALVVTGPVLRIVAMRAPDAERASVADIHDGQQRRRRPSLENLNVLEHRLRRLLFLALDLLA